MEELKIIIEAMSKMGEGASTAFIWWCVKEVFISLMFPVSLIVIGKFVHKCVVDGIKTYND